MENRKQKILFSLILVFILLSTSIDLWQDWGEGINFRHFALEISICLLTLLGLISLWFTNLFLKNELFIINTELDRTKKESLKWKQENATLISGLSNAIDQQLVDWKLSPSEKEIALLLLKGLSLKEIADIRSVSERTVRQQSTHIYQKSNLTGRAELSAYFLEDLLK